MKTILYLYMKFKDYLTKVLKEKEYAVTDKGLVVMSLTEEVLTFASIADMLDSEASYLDMYHIDTDRDDNNVIKFIVSETQD